MSILRKSGLVYRGSRIFILLIKLMVNFKYLFSCLIVSLLVVGFGAVSSTRTNASTPWCKEEISSVRWILRDYYEGGNTLSIVPTDCGRNIFYATSKWDEVKSRFSGEYNKAVNSIQYTWRGYAADSLKNQFFCHVKYATNKYDWNVEPWRQNVYYLDLFNQFYNGIRCNPSAYTTGASGSW